MSIYHFEFVKYMNEQIRKAKQEIIKEFVKDLEQLIKNGMNDLSEDETFDLIKKWEKKR